VTRPLLPLWAAVLTAAAAGPVLDAGFPDRDIWPLTFVGIALVLVTLVGRRAGAGFLVGLVAGLSFYLVHIGWATEFLGDVIPMLALVALESLFFAVGSMTITLAYRWLPRVWSGRLGLLGLLPVVVAGLWTAREAIASVWPYGGFAWGRVALSQSQSPVSDLFAWLGVSGVSFVMVLVVAVAIEAARLPGMRGTARAAVAVAVAALVLLVPALPTVSDGSIRVAAVQGNGKAAYLDRRERGDLLLAQFEATQAIADKTADVVLWPEGGTDVNPIVNRDAAEYFDVVSEEFGGVPVVSGAITEDGDDIYNSSILWLPGQGAVDIYNKRHPVPFGEYIPDRAFWRPFAPDLIDLVQREYTIGTTDAVFDLGAVTVGVNICFDIVDDQLMAESVRDGAQVIFAQSNNADFGRTDESLQQLAIARIRAMELGRSVVNISTVGTSAIIRADGSTLAQLPWYTPGAMVENVPTSSITTPAVLLGRQLEWLVSFFALAVLLLGGIMGRRRHG
jgi:apolipoprotein N-acyltransferase